MKIAIINTLPVPSGQASVNRLLSYSKGLSDLGNEVTIMSSGFKQSLSLPSLIDGVEVYNYGIKLPRPLSLFHALFKISNALVKSNVNVVILVSNALSLIWPLFFICKIKRIRFVLEKSEYPFSMMKKGLLNKLYSFFYINTTYKLFDGLIVMTKPLMDFFKPLVKRKCPLFEMPMTVDIDRFIQCEKDQNPEGDYIAFCGGLSKTNGISNLIEAFSIVEPKYPYLKLLIIGGASNIKVIDGYKAEVKKYGLKNVCFYGQVERDEIPHLLINAKVLLLARPSNLQASGGFPTKLGEYLATGNPVVVTAVGDIPLYLNSSNSYIVEPDNNKAYASKVLEVLADDCRAKQIGKEGQKLALSVFNAKVQSERLNKYLETLVSD